MNDKEFELLTKKLSLNTPADLLAIEKSQFDLGTKLPDDYLSFILRSNGAVGTVGLTGYLRLSPIDELVEFNQGYCVKDFAPGLLLFGSDGGGEAFAFDLRDPSMPIVGVPFVGMSLEEVQVIAPTFTEFLKGNW